MITSVRAIDPYGLLEDEHSHCVSAVIEPALLETLRVRLEPMRNLHVVVTSALAWGKGRQLRYRGGSVRVDQEVRRVEIVCRACDLDAVVNAVQRVTNGRALSVHDSQVSSDVEVPAAAGLATDC